MDTVLYILARVFSDNAWTEMQVWRCFLGVRTHLFNSYVNTEDKMKIEQEIVPPGKRQIIWTLLI